ncbi:MAG: hypothetical protein AAF791_04730 [Bacteroidota bacterium]
MTPLSLLLAAAAYGAFYAAAPGRQSRALGPTRTLLWAGTALTVAALGLSIAATGSSVGPVLVVTVMMATASVLAVVGPFVFPEAAETARTRTATPASGRAPTMPPGARLPGTTPARPPGTTPARPPGSPPGRPPTFPPSPPPPSS